MTATFLPVGGAISPHRLRRLRPATLSPAKRLSWQIATGSSSTWVRRQALSQGRGQTRPMMRGSGSRRLTILMASASSPRAMAPVGGDVDARRAGVMAGRLAIGVMGGQVLVERLAAGLGDLRRLADDLHAVGHRGLAGIDDAVADDLDQAKAAAARGREAWVAAESGDLDAVGLRRLEDGHARIDLQIAAIDEEPDLRAAFGDYFVMRKIGHLFPF